MQCRQQRKPSGLLGCGLCAGKLLPEFHRLMRLHFSRDLWVKTGNPVLIKRILNPPWVGLCHACAMLGSRLHLQAVSSFCQNQDLLPTKKRHALLLLRTRCDTGRNLLSEGRWGADVSSSSKLLQQRTW